MSKENMPLEEKFQFKWNAEAPDQSLDEIVAYARRVAWYACDWYAREKTRKSRGAKSIRILAIILGGLGGCIPILSTKENAAGAKLVSPAWATLSMACSGIVLLFDRFYGVSTGWMRFAKSMLAIRAKITSFDMDIASHKKIDQEKIDIHRDADRTAAASRRSGKVARIGVPAKQCACFYPIFENSSDMGN